MNTHEELITIEQLQEVIDLLRFTPTPVREENGHWRVDTRDRGPLRLTHDAFEEARRLRGW